jgi:hypothetical protein
MITEPLRYMSETERSCVHRYIEIMARRLEGDLVEVWLFGSFARGDMWGKSWPMSSDIDLLILTIHLLHEEDREHLINETYPLYLECGRQLSPQFRTVAEFENPTTERGATFKERIAEEGRMIFSRDSSPPKHNER